MREMLSSMNMKLTKNSEFPAILITQNLDKRLATLRMTSTRTFTRSWVKTTGMGTFASASRNFWISTWKTGSDPNCGKAAILTTVLKTKWIPLSSVAPSRVGRRRPLTRSTLGSRTRWASTLRRCSSLMAPWTAERKSLNLTSRKSETIILYAVYSNQ